MTGGGRGWLPELVFVQAMGRRRLAAIRRRRDRQPVQLLGIGAVRWRCEGRLLPGRAPASIAQVQHLRAYADSSVTTASLANTVVDPRFTYVRKGAAPVVGKYRHQENPNRRLGRNQNTATDLVSMMKAYF